MARKTSSRLSKRREVEAAEALDKTKSTTKKKRKKAAKKKTTTRRKTKATERKRLVWGVFSSSLKEEARFPYDERKEAEKKLKALLDKGKRMYFIQPIKEVITDAAPSEKASTQKAVVEKAVTKKDDDDDGGGEEE